MIAIWVDFGTIFRSTLALKHSLRCRWGWWKARGRLSGIKTFVSFPVTTGRRHWTLLRIGEIPVRPAW